ncbi:hypothetical protein [Nocardia asteroides]|uniref:hypothetical protein n=1 Tax=Nocardia asteroides TaxID=1824 RepID=UPI001E2888F5|nr:hypothetical protein [Nocardia asteroides]UGT54430.1 hypothetical protein LTT85_27965 [Nocardia asteroides]
MSGTESLNLPIAELVSTIQQINTEIETVRYDWNSLSAEMHGAAQGWGGESATAAASFGTAFDKVGSAVLTALSGITTAVTTSIQQFGAVDSATAAALTQQTGR